MSLTKVPVILFLAIGVIGSTGCVAAIPLAASGAVAYGVNASAKGAIDNNLDAQSMNCSQLRERYKQLESNKLANFNPFANQSLKVGQVRAIAQAKGCRFP